MTLTIIQIPDFQFGSSAANNHVTVEPGAAGVFTFTLAPQTSGFANPITFSASGLPPGATVAFSPASITLGTSTSTLTMTVQTAAVTARNEQLGEAHAFKGLFPAPGGTLDGSLSFASQLGGAVDVDVSRHLAMRMAEVSWVRMQLPNDLGNVQNNLRLGAGLVYRFNGR